MPEIDYRDAECPMPECTSALHLEWTRSRPLVVSDITDGEAIHVHEAWAGGWRVACEEGHVVLIPGDLPDDEHIQCEPDEHDHDEELRTFTKTDAARLAATLAWFAKKG